MIFIAASTSLALRSGSLYSAISLSCALVMCPTVVVFEFGDPFLIPAAFNNKGATGVVLMTKSNDLSS